MDLDYRRSIFRALDTALHPASVGKGDDEIARMLFPSVCSSAGWATAGTGAARNIVPITTDIRFAVHGHDPVRSAVFTEIWNSRSIGANVHGQRGRKSVRGGSKRTRESNRIVTRNCRQPGAESRIQIKKAISDHQIDRIEP
jgi:hypothetical protein